MSDAARGSDAKSPRYSASSATTSPHSGDGSSRKTRKSKSGVSLKKFTRGQIRQKVEERWAIPEYHDMLMQCAVKEDETGIYFNLRHPTFSKLVELCREFDNQQGRTIRSSTMGYSSSSAAAASSSSSSTTTTTTKGRIRSDVSASAASSSARRTGSSSSSSSSRIVGGHSTADSSGGLTEVKPLRTTTTTSASSGSGSRQRKRAGTGDASISGGSSSMMGRGSKRGRSRRSDQDWLDLLTNELQKHEPNAEVIRESCKHIGIPSNLRSTIWKILLGVPQRRTEFLTECKATAYRKEKEAEAAAVAAAAAAAALKKEAEAEAEAMVAISDRELSVSESAEKSVDTSTTRASVDLSGSGLGYEPGSMVEPSTSTIAAPSSSSSGIPAVIPSKGGGGDEIVLLEGMHDDSTRDDSVSVSVDEPSVGTGGRLKTALKRRFSRSKTDDISLTETERDHSLTAKEGTVKSTATVATAMGVTSTTTTTSTTCIRREKKRKRRRRQRSRYFGSMPLRDSPPHMSNQRVIQADIERTRAQLELFQSSTIRTEMEIILTEYCTRHKVTYKQGMNYILAPFIMVGMKSRLDLYLSFESFVESFLKSTFNDDEFGSLQCIFRCFRLLLQYHDPFLSIYLDTHGVMPELFAAGWFMTCHANKSDPSTLLHIWDNILLFHRVYTADFFEDAFLKKSGVSSSSSLLSTISRSSSSSDTIPEYQFEYERRKQRRRVYGNNSAIFDRSYIGSCFHYFIDIELLRVFREEICKKTSEELPAYLVQSVQFDGRDMARRVIKEAFNTFRQTPLSFHDLLNQCCKESIKVDSPLYRKLEKLPCLSISCSELLAFAYRDSMASLPFDSNAIPKHHGLTSVNRYQTGGGPSSSVSLPIPNEKNVSEIFVCATEAANAIAKLRGDSPIPLLKGGPSSESCSTLIGDGDGSSPMDSMNVKKKDSSSGGGGSSRFKLSLSSRLKTARKKMKESDESAAAISAVTATAMTSVSDQQSTMMMADGKSSLDDDHGPADYLTGSAVSPAVTSSTHTSSGDTMMGMDSESGLITTADSGAVMTSDGHLDEASVGHGSSSSSVSGGGGSIGDDDESVSSDNNDGSYYYDTSVVSLNLSIEYANEMKQGRLESLEYFMRTAHSSLSHSHSSLMRLDSSERSTSHSPSGGPPSSAPPSPPVRPGPSPRSIATPAVSAAAAERVWDGFNASSSQSSQYLSGPPKYFIIDCRPLDEYNAGHLPCAFHLDPAYDLSSEELRMALKSLLSMSGCHFVIFMDGRRQTHSTMRTTMDPLQLQQMGMTNDPFSQFNSDSQTPSMEIPPNDSEMLLTSYLLFFLEKRVKFVSVCDSGYMGCHLLLNKNEHMKLINETRIFDALAKVRSGAVDAVDHYPYSSKKQTTTSSKKKKQKKRAKSVDDSADGMLDVTLMSSPVISSEQRHCLIISQSICVTVQSELDLIDHARVDCLECNGKWKDKLAKSGIDASMDDASSSKAGAGTSAASATSLKARMGSMWKSAMKSTSSKVSTALGSGPSAALTGLSGIVGGAMTPGFSGPGSSHGSGTLGSSLIGSLSPSIGKADAMFIERLRRGQLKYIIYSSRSAARAQGKSVVQTVPFSNDFSADSDFISIAETYSKQKQQRMIAAVTNHHDLDKDPSQLSAVTTVDDILGIGGGGSGPGSVTGVSSAALSGSPDVLGSPMKSKMMEHTPPVNPIAEMFANGKVHLCRNEPMLLFYLSVLRDKQLSEKEAVAAAAAKDSTVTGKSGGESTETSDAADGSATVESEGSKPSGPSLSSSKSTGLSPATCAAKFKSAAHSILRIIINQILIHEMCDASEYSLNNLAHFSRTALYTTTASMTSEDGTTTKHMKGDLGSTSMATQMAEEVHTLNDESFLSGMEFGSSGASMGGGRAPSRTAPSVPHSIPPSVPSARGGQISDVTGSISSKSSHSSRKRSRIFKFKKVERESVSGDVYSGLQCLRGIYGVGLNDSNCTCLKYVLQSMEPCLRSVVGTLKVESCFSECEDGVIRSNRQAVALMPKDISHRIVLLFHPTLIDTDRELHSCIDALLKLGAKIEMVVLVSVVASLKALLSLNEHFDSKLTIWTAAIDSQLKSGRLVPGIGSFKHRYKLAH